MGACLVGVDAISMALLAVAALRWQGTAKEERMNTAVMVMQVLALAGENFSRSSLNAVVFYFSILVSYLREP